jgi:hypothetical protein
MALAGDRAAQRPGGEHDDGHERGEQRAGFLAELLQLDHAERGVVAGDGVLVAAGFRFTEERFQAGFVLAAAAEQILIGRPEPHTGEDECGQDSDSDELHVGRKMQQPAKEEIHHGDDEMVERGKHVRRVPRA